MTPLLCPVWCAASRSSASSTTAEARVRSVSAKAVARPTMPPPITATLQRSGIMRGAAPCRADSDEPGVEARNVVEGPWSWDGARRRGSRV